MAGNKLFVDTNILVYANTTNSPFCTMARNKLKSAFQTYDSVWISNQVMREYLSSMTKIMLSVGKVDYQSLAKDIHNFENNFQLAPDNSNIIKSLLTLIEQTKTAWKQVHDANIVATMLESDIQTILTNNIADFQRFGQWIHIEPLQWDATIAFQLFSAPTKSFARDSNGTKTESPSSILLFTSFFPIFVNIENKKSRDELHSRTDRHGT